jgi:hypothetical protein
MSGGASLQDLFNSFDVSEWTHLIPGPDGIDELFELLFRDSTRLV